MTSRYVRYVHLPVRGGDFGFNLKVFLNELSHGDMAAMKKVLLAVVVAAFAVLLGRTFLRIKGAMLASREMPVKHLKCHYLQNLENGAEDITILKHGLAFISTGLKFPELPSFSDEPGKMFVMDLLQPNPTPVELQIKGEVDLNSFNLHGISVYTDEADDSTYVFVVNHPQGASQVEIFRFVEEDTLVHLKTITHPLLHSVNDIVAVGKESFYASNHAASPSRALTFLAMILDWHMCDVIYYSPGDVRVAADGIASGNGINISPDKRYIYVSDIMDHDIDVYERKKGEKLEFIKSVGVGSLCDNIEVDHSTGDLWLGCHPNGLRLMTFDPKDPKDPPGSEVIRIKNIHSDHPVVSLEYADDGQVLMGSTVATPYEGKLLIGTSFHRALYCDLK